MTRRRREGRAARRRREERRGVARVFGVAMWHLGVPAGEPDHVAFVGTRTHADALRWALRHWQAPEHAAVAVEAIGPLRKAQLDGLDEGDIHGAGPRTVALSDQLSRCSGRAAAR